MEAGGHPLLRQLSLTEVLVSGRNEFELTLVGELHFLGNATERSEQRRTKKRKREIRSQMLNVPTSLSHEIGDFTGVMLTTLTGVSTC